MAGVLFPAGVLGLAVAMLVSDLAASWQRAQRASATPSTWRFAMASFAAECSPVRCWP